MKAKSGAWAASAAVLALVVAGGLAWKYSQASQQGEWAMAPAKVAVAPGVQAAFPMALSGIGSLEATRQVQVPAEVDGRVTQILFTAGQQVKAGQLLVQMNDAPEQGELARLQAQTRNARALLERTRRLLPQQAATREQLEQAQADYDQAAADIKRVQALIEQKRVKAPFDGVLGVRRVNLGQFTRAGDALVSLTDASTVYANITLPEQGLGAVRAGQPVTVTVDAHAGREFAGQVTTVEPQVDAGSRTVRVQATLANADGALAAGMFAHGRIGLPDRPNVITVPETAVSYSAYGDSVFVLTRPKSGQDGAAATVRQAYVKTAERLRGRVVVAEGLQAGDQVVTSGQLRLHNGAAVEVIPSDTVALGTSGQAPMQTLAQTVAQAPAQAD
jgi:multidrug efflux system membrane fusion protein